MGKPKHKQKKEALQPRTCNIEFVMPDGEHSGNCGISVPCTRHAGVLADVILLTNNQPYLSPSVPLECCAVMTVLNATEPENVTQPCGKPLPCPQHNQVGNRTPEGFPGRDETPETEPPVVPADSIATRCQVAMADDRGTVTRPCGGELPDCPIHHTTGIIYLDKPGTSVLTPLRDENDGICGLVEMEGMTFTESESDDLSTYTVGHSAFDFGYICDLNLPCRKHGNLARPPRPPPEQQLGPPRPVKLASINLTQLLNVREQITDANIEDRANAINRGMIQKAAVVWPQARAGELLPPGEEFAPKDGAEYVLLGGNITTLAHERLAHEEVLVCDFLGDARAARIYIGADNEGAVPMTSYEKAKWLAGLLQGDEFKGGMELQEELTKSGMSISLAHCRNLVRTYRKLIPEAKEAWSKRRALRGNENEYAAWAGTQARHATDECVFWLASCPPALQEKHWKKIITGTPWRSLKNEGGPGKPEKKAPTFLGAPLQKRDAYAYKTQWDSVKGALQDRPEVLSIVEAAVKHVLVGSPWRLFELPAKAAKKEPPKKKLAAKKKKGVRA